MKSYIKILVWYQVLFQTFFIVFNSFSPTVYASVKSSPFSSDRKGTTLAVSSPFSSDREGATPAVSSPFSSDREGATSAVSSLSSPNREGATPAVSSPFSSDREDATSAVSSLSSSDREGVTPAVSSLSSSDTIQAASSSDGSTLPFSSQINQAASLLSSGNSVDSARSMAVGMASGQLQKWFGAFGTARIQLNIDRHGSWSHSSGDLLVPLYDNGQSLLFVQGGIRKPSDRLTANLGYGVRTFWQNGWMYGGNVFYDNDFTGHNRRVGIGGEAWRDYFRLSANTYLGTTQWHTSRDFDGTWQEKPSDGYDVRAEGWLPGYPQLGGKLIWEQYYGDQVALFDKDRLQHNPSAVTAGIEYTPIPLITFGADHRQGRGTQDTQLALGIHWNFSRDLRWQVNPANVDSMRTLSGSRYELVNRNNEIVLQYRKNPDETVAHLALTVVTDNSPADGVTRNVLQVLATNRNGQPARNASIEWSAQSDGSVSLATVSAVTDNDGLAAITLSSTKEQTVPVTAKSGSAIAMQNSHFTRVEVSHIALAVTHDNAVADGRSTDSVVATLTDSNGSPITGQTVKWELPVGVTQINDSSLSDKNGMVTLQLVSTVAGNETINALAGSTRASEIVHFVGNAASAKIGSLSITTDGSPADGKTVNVAQVTVTDVNGNALAGQTLNWKSTKSTVTFGQSAVTDSSGRTTVSYTDTVAESLTLTASLANGNSATADSRFVIGGLVLKELSVTSGAKASGDDANTATVTVTDENGNVLSGQTVTFSVTGSAKLATVSASTGGDGKAQVKLTDEVAETIQVTAKLSNGSSKTEDSTFTEDLSNAILSITSTTGALSDGSSTNTATVTLKDKNNSVLPGQSITLSVSGSAKLSAVSATTNSNGQVQVTFADTVAETVTVTATLGSGKTASTKAEFITYTVTDLSTSTTSLKADGSTSATIIATVKDGNDTIVADALVTFSVTGSAVLSSTTVKTNSSGQAQVTLTDTAGETVAVTAKAKDNSNDAGKTQSITFTESVITGVTVYGAGHTFAAGSNFPETGYAGAKMTFVVDDTEGAAENYTWSSDRSWVNIEDGSTAVMAGTTSSGSKSNAPDASERTVTITATPKKGGKTLTYTFTLKKWYERSSQVTVSHSSSSTTVLSACKSYGGSVPYASDLTDGTSSVVGKLLGEWRDAPSLDPYYWVQETYTTWAAKEKIALVYKTGEISASTNPGAAYVMCLIP